MAIQLERTQPKPPDTAITPKPGWRRARTTPSLVEVYRTVPVAGKGWWRKILAFAGPGYLVAVGYMDPGNWATDLAGGAQFGYTLLTVILASNLMAILLQGLASKLGIVTGRDLAQACRDNYSRPVNFLLWVGCEIAIAACDLAEVIGTAILVFTIFGATSKTADPSRAGVTIGFALAAIVWTFGPISGASLNPARTWGPTFASAVFSLTPLGNLWIYIIGPVLGGLLGAFLYDALR